MYIQLYIYMYVVAAVNSLCYISGKNALKHRGEVVFFMCSCSGELTIHKHASRCTSVLITDVTANRAIVYPLQ